MSEIKKINVNGVDYDLASKYSHVHNNKNELDNLSTLYRDKNKANKAYAPSVKKTLTGPFVIENGVDGNLIDWSIRGTNIGNKNTTTGKYDIDITVSSKNIIPYPFYYTSKTINGITFTDNGDGTITANGTATADAQFMLHNISWDNQTPIAMGTYYLSGCPNGGSGTTYQLGLRIRTDSSSTDTVTSIDYGNGAKLTIASGEPRFDTYIIIRKNATVNNILFKPQLEAGSVATEFELYSEPQTVKISLNSALNGLLTRSSAKVELPVFNGTTIYTFNTSAQPSEFKVKYPQSIETYIKENSLDTSEADDRYLMMDECSGVVLQTKNAMAGETRNYQIYGNSLQATRSGKNLIKYPYYDKSTSINGITYTINDDGTIIVNGTSTSDSVLNLNVNVPIKSGTYKLSGCSVGGAYDTYNLQVFNSDIDISDCGKGASVVLTGDTTIVVRIRVCKAGLTLNNLVFKPQLELGSTITSYEQYGASPSSEFPSEVESVGDLVTSGEHQGEYKVETRVTGKNLLPYPYADTTKTVNGITFTDNGDGTIAVNGTASARATFYIKYSSSTLINFNDSVMVSDGTTDSSSTKYYISFGCVGADTGEIAYISTSNGRATISNLYNAVSSIQLIVEKGVTVNNIIFKPQLEIGTVATDYEPYTANTITTYLTEPLRKIGNYADYIDYKNQKVIRYIKPCNISTLKSNNAGVGNTCIRVSISFADAMDKGVSNPPVFCTHFQSGVGISVSSITEKISLQTYSNYLYINILKSRLTGTTNTELTASANAYIKSLNAIVYYVLKTPTEEPVTLALVPLYDGTNNITVDTTIQPSNIFVSYYTDLRKKVNEIATDEAEDTIELQAQIDKLTFENEKSALIQEKCTLTEEISGVTVQTKNAVDINAIDYRVYGDSIQETNNGDFTNVSGEALVVSTDCIDVGYLKLSGNSVQNGTPTPTAPVDIESVGELITDESSEHTGKYKIVTNVCGKNLIPYPYYNSSRTLNGITFTANADGSITVNGTATAEAIFHCGGTDWNVQTPILKGNYFLSGCPAGGSASTYKIGLRTKAGSTGTAEIKAQDIGSGAPVSITNDNTRFDIYVNIKAGVTINNLTFSPQLEIGSTATTYEKYIATSMVAYLDEPLRKIGDCADYVDYENQKVVRKICCGVVQNSLLRGCNSYKYTSTNGGPVANSESQKSNMCEYTYSASVNGEWHTYVSRTLGVISLIAPDVNTVIGTYLTENNITSDLKVYYALATPTSESITIESVKTSTGYTVGQSIVDMNTLKGTLSATMYKSYPYPSPRKLSEVQSVGDLVTSGEHKGKYKVETKVVNGDYEYITTIYLDKPLYKVGNYADYIDYKNQKVIRNIGSIKYNGIENWNALLPNTYASIKISNATSYQPILSNRYIYNTANSDNVVIIKSGCLYVYDSNNMPNMTTWKAQLAEWNTVGNPLKVFYALATPTEEDIMLEPLPLENGVNNIFCSTVMPPSNINVEYFKDPDKEFSEIKSTLASLQSQIDELKNS